MTWAQVPGDAIEGGARNAAYAALVTLPVLTVPTRAWGVRLGHLLTAGLGILVLGTLIALHRNGVTHFLAGRLNDPVGYRNGTAALFALAFWPLVCIAARRASHALLRASCFSLALVALGLAFVTQSRGVLLGFLGGAIVAVALGPDRLRRICLALLVVGGARRAVASAARAVRRLPGQQRDLGRRRLARDQRADRARRRRLRRRARPRAARRGPARLPPPPRARCAPWPAPRWWCSRSSRSPSASRGSGARSRCCATRSRSSSSSTRPRRERRGSGPPAASATTSGGSPGTSSARRRSTASARAATSRLLRPAPHRPQPLHAAQPACWSCSRRPG